MRITFFVLACICVGTSVAQVPTRGFALGESMAQAWAHNGRPAGRKPVADVWYRKVPGNEFEVRVSYEEDASVSRLHPTPRVSELSFWPDHNEPWSAMLQRISEVRALCVDGCSAEGWLYSSSQSGDIGLSDEVIALCRPGYTVENRPPTEVCAEVSFDYRGEMFDDPQRWSTLNITSVGIEPWSTVGILITMQHERQTMTSLGLWMPQ